MVTKTTISMDITVTINIKDITDTVVNIHIRPMVEDIQQPTNILEANITVVTIMRIQDTKVQVMVTMLMAQIGIVNIVEDQDPMACTKGTNKLFIYSVRSILFFNIRFL